MATGPRPWQRNLSNLSVTSKVGIVLILPVVLASVFAVLRIKDELSMISQLDVASRQSQVIRPLIDFGTATERLQAIVSSGDRVDPTAVDRAAANYDQTIAALQSALATAQTDQQVTAEITDAMASGRSLRRSAHSISPTAIATQADDIVKQLANAISTLATPKNAVIERDYTQLGDLLLAGRPFVQQQLIIGSGEISNNPQMLAQALSAAGSELSMINQYALLQPASAYKPEVLIEGQQTRLRALSQNAVEPRMIPGVADSLTRSAATYVAAGEHATALISDELSRTSIDARSTVLRDVSSVAFTLLAGLTLALWAARSLVVPVGRLRRGALQVAHVDLPAELAVVREGGATPEILPIDVQSTEELGQLARAIDDMHRQALHLAAEQARLRLLISSMFETLSRRSQSLVEQQLMLIEDLERDEENPGRLQSMFRLDHLATRMRRNGDNLLVLAGTTLRRGQLPAVPLSDMLWSAISQVEDYQRVEIGAVPDGIIAGEPAVDIEHLLAELIDNSLRYSPPSTPVAVSVSEAAEGGYQIEITDRGLGMSGDDLRSANDRLASGGEVTVDTARRMGLFVVGRLAKRHTVTVSLRRTSTMAQQQGITATVHLPKSLVGSDKPGAGELPGTPLPGTPLPGTPFPATPISTAAHAASEDIPAPVPLFGSSVTELPQRRPARNGSGRGTSADIVADDEPAAASIANPEPIQDGVIGYRPRTGKQDSFNAFAPASDAARDPWTVPDKPAPKRQRAQADESTARAWPRPAVASQRTPESDPAEEDWDQENRDDDQRQETARWNSGDAWSDVVRWEETESEASQRSWQDQPTSSDRSRTGVGEEPVLRPRRRRLPADSWPSGEFPPIPAEEPAPANVREPARASSWEDEPADLWAQTATLPVQQPDSAEPVTESPIYQRMVSEWLVEPSASEPTGAWSSPADEGWAAAEEASRPTMDHHTPGGLPIRNPGAQLVPGGLAPTTGSGAPNPEEIRNNLSRHLSGVRSGRAGLASYGAENRYNGTRSGGALEHHDAQNNDGGHL